MSFVYFGAVACVYGLTFFLPTIVKAFGMTNFETGLVVAIPYCFGAAAMVLWGQHSDRTGERKGHTVVALSVAAAGLAGATLVSSPAWQMVAFVFATLGTYASLPVIWTLPTAHLSGAAAAGGIAVVNSIGNLSGFVGPYAMGYIKEHTGSFNGGLWLLASGGLAAAAIVLALRHDRRLEQVTGGDQRATEPG